MGSFRIPDEVLKRFKCFKKKDIELFIVNEVISGDFQERDLKILEVIAKIWRKRSFLKRQLAAFSYGERLNLIETCHYNKLDSFIFSRIRDARLKREKLDIERLVMEVLVKFNFPINDKTKELIRKKIKVIRKSVWQFLFRRKEYLKKLERQEKRYCKFLSHFSEGIENGS